MTTQWKLIKDIIEVNLMCKLKSLMVNLSISNDLDWIKMTLASDNKLQDSLLPYIRL